MGLYDLHCVERISWYLVYMMWKGSQIVSTFVCSAIAVFIAAYTTPAATGAPALETHYVATALGTEPLPLPTHHVYQGERKDSRRVNTFTEGVVAFLRLNPERSAPFALSVPCATLPVYDVFVLYLPRDPPIV